MVKHTEIGLYVWLRSEIRSNFGRKAVERMYMLGGVDVSQEGGLDTVVKKTNSRGGKAIALLNSILWDETLQR